MTSLINKVSLYGTISAALGLILYIGFMNLAPLGAKDQISLGNGIKEITPITRITKTDESTTINDNLVYFKTDLARNYDKAKVELTYKNSSPNHQILIGYKDRLEWHYNTKVMAAPFLQDTNFTVKGTGPYLYDKTNRYASVVELVNSPPENAVIGTYDLSNRKLIDKPVVLKDYTADEKHTTIDTPLRGKVIFYVYIKDEPFELDIEKRDLNWYIDGDAVKVAIFKDQDEVASGYIGDDGNITDNRQTGISQKTTIKNPGPGLPETGVYKIVIDTSNDTTITRIKTNSHKVVFEGPIFPVSNTSIYPGIVKKTSSNLLVTDSNSLTLKSIHPVIQNVLIDKKPFPIANSQKDLVVNNLGNKVQLIIPQSNVIINGNGHFAFDDEHFFSPTAFKTFNITNSSDVQNADFIISDFSSEPLKQKEWNKTTREFSLSDAVSDDNTLSWVIEVPENDSNKIKYQIKDIKITYFKDSWFK